MSSRPPSRAQGSGSTPSAAAPAGQPAVPLYDLAEAAGAIHAALSVHDVLRVVAEKAREAVGAHRAVARVTGDGAGAEAIEHVSVADDDAAGRGDDAPRDGSALPPRAGQADRPTSLEHAAADTPPPGGALAAPLTGRDGRNIGLIRLSGTRGGDFTAHDEAMVVQLAQMASVAVENARRYADAERRRRAAEFLAELAETINASLDLDVVLRRIAQGAEELCHGDLAEIALWDESAQVMVLRYWAPSSPPGYGNLPIERGRGCGGLVMATGRPFRTDDYAHDSRISMDYLAAAQEVGIVSQIVVPIGAEGRVEGLLYVGRRSRHPFTDADEALLLRLAHHAGIAISNARLYAEAERRRRAAAALVEVGGLVSRTLDIEEVGQRIVDSLRQLLEGMVATLYRTDPGSGDLIVLRSSSDRGAAWHPGETLPRGASISGQAVAQRRPVSTLDTLTDPAIVLSPDLRARVERLGYRVILALPLLIQDRVIGALAVGRGAGQAFDEEETRLAQAFADQAAVALENARLFGEQARLLDETRGQHEEALAFEMVARQITSSLEREEVLERIVHRAQDLCGCDLAWLAPCDPETGTARVVAGSGTRSRALFAVTLPPGRGAGGRVLETGEPFVTDDYVADRRISRDYVESAIAEGTVAEAVVPIRLRGRVTGLLCVAHRTPKKFGARDLAILGKLADQAAIALENSRLYGERVRVEVELRVRARQQAAIAELGQRALAEADVAAVMEEAIALVAQTLDVEYCQILELRPGGDALLLRAGVGWRDGSVGHATVGTGLDSQAGYTLLHDQPVVVEDLASETRFTGPTLLHEHGVVSGASVVIRGLGQPFGVLGAHTRERRRFTADDAHFLQSVANVLATAIGRKRAEDAVRQHAERLTMLHEIDQAILGAQSPEAIAQVAVRRIRRLVPCRRASVVLFDFDADRAVVLAVDYDGVSSVPAGSTLPLQEAFGDLEDLRTGQVRVAEHPASGASSPPFMSAFSEEGLQSVVGVPLLSRSSLVGTLNLWAGAGDTFTPPDIEIAREVADSLAIAIQNSALFAQVVAGRERLQTLSRRLVEIQEAERRHLARELHDEIGQVLTGLKLTLEMGARASGDLAARRREEARTLLDNLITRVRQLSLDLRPAMLDDLGLLPALLWHFERYGSVTGVRVRFEHGGLERRLPPEIETAAYRIAQEALTNVARHAGVDEATVWVWSDDDALNVHVEDLGRGFDPAAASASATGLAGMRERAALLGGHVVVDTSPGAGTRVTAGLPVDVPLERRRAAR